MWIVLLELPLMNSISGVISYDYVFLASLLIPVSATVCIFHAF